MHLNLHVIQTEIFLWRIGTGMNYRISELSGGNISRKDFVLV